MSAIPDTGTDTDSDTDTGVIEFTLEEAWADYAYKTRLYMDMEPDEFFRRLDAGEYNEIIDDPENDILYLAQLGNGLRSL